MHSLSVPKENSQDKGKDISKYYNREKWRDKRQATEDEIQRLMDTYGNDVLRTAYMYLKDMQKAEDAFQEVFIKVYKKFGSFRGESSEKTWIIRITINVCKDILRSSWLNRVLLTDKIRPEGKGPDIEDGFIEKDENRRLFEEVLSLPPQYKDVIILFYYQSYSTSEISNILDIAEGTVRSRLHRARERLKSKLGGRIDLSE